MNNIIDFFLRLVGRERTIERITSSANKVIRDLDSLSARHKAKGIAAEKQAAKLQKTAERNHAEAEDAKALSENWKNSGLVRAVRKAA